MICRSMGFLWSLETAIWLYSWNPCIWWAAQEPQMRTYLIEWSQTATNCKLQWNDNIFNSIAWSYMGKAIQKLPVSQCIRLLKYVNNILPMAKHLQTFDNKHDGHCFECGQLWEDMNHVLQCLSDAWDKTWNEAFKVLCTHFEKQHTPTVLTELLCDSMAHWINWWRIPTPQWTNPDKPILTAITTAFHSQKNFRWDQFFHERLSKAWITGIEIYYWECRPGSIFTPDHWMRTMIEVIWTFSLTLWRQ